MTGNDHVGAGSVQLLGENVALGGEHEAVDEVDAAVDDAEAQPADVKVSVLGSAAIQARLAGDMRALANGYQPLASRSHSLPSSKPQAQSSAAAASCSSQLPAMTWQPQSRTRAVVSSGSAQ